MSEISRIGFIADLLGAWEILPPSGKERYEAYAEKIRRETAAVQTINYNHQTFSKLTGKEEEENTDASWESTAYRCFLREGQRQLEASVGPLEGDGLAGSCTEGVEQLNPATKETLLSGVGARKKRGNKILASFWGAVSNFIFGSLLGACEKNDRGKAG
uniref:N4 n=1 Tax=Trypanosoma cruzi TaxID=5693 RepID=Q94788_TRYCR|nr:N4 [Trypanosoma cruzi]